MLSIITVIVNPKKHIRNSQWLIIFIFGMQKLYIGNTVEHVLICFYFVNTVETDHAGVPLQSVLSLVTYFKTLKLSGLWM